MKPLLAIFSCHKQDWTHDYIRDWFQRVPTTGRVEALRDSWLKDVTIDYKIFYGKPPRGMLRMPLADEVFLDCPDNYYNTADKTPAIIRWALNEGYDRLLKVDDDVFVYWDRMLKSKGFTGGDYVGGAWDQTTNYVFGGAYWLSSKAMNILAPLRRSPNEWAEDKWVGDRLLGAGIRYEFEPNYFYKRPILQTDTPFVDAADLENKDYIVLHALNPDTMRTHYENVCLGRHRVRNGSKRRGKAQAREVSRGPEAPDRNELR